MKHLTDIKEFTKNDLEHLFKIADDLDKTPINERKKWHQGKTAMALFFENSTRTLVSFQLACQRLGIDFTALNIAHSSTQKGETIKDTLLTLNAMHTDLLIIRHQHNGIQQEMIEWLDDQAAVINAGDGTNQHPTQGLLDLYTIKQHQSDFTQLKVTIIGDIKHSRVANSLLDGLQIMGTTNIQLYAPDTLIPSKQKHRKATSLQAALDQSDVVVMLRIQKERLGAEIDIDFADWHKLYGLNKTSLGWAKPNAMVMHPGPLNRGVEISDEVADGSQSVILKQVKNGVLMRQALIHHLLS